jgi:multidrug efflux pump subunit AcrB
LIGSTVTPIVVFLPLISIAGVTGTFFRALAVTVTVALLTSLLLAVTWTPNLSQYFISSKPRFGGKPSADGEMTTDQLLAAEEASLTGVFGKIVRFYEKVLRIALERPRWIAILSLVLIACAYASYRGLGTDLLPEMDEGGFIVDYLMPAGTSLQETDRDLEHVEQILHSIPEVETTSRRTGLQLGLAAVTEANSGDFTVKLKQDRSRSVEEVMEEVRAKVHQSEPALDIELLQLLQDMIGDLSNAPEPVQIKLFSNDPAILKEWARVSVRPLVVPGVSTF